MESPIKVLDADLRYKDGPIELIKVCHESCGRPRTWDDICGHDFFLRWLPQYIQKRYKDLEGYWYAMHPRDRDDHIAAYLLERSKIQLN